MSIKTTEEFNKIYFPNKVLERLDEKISEALSLRKGQHSLYTDDNKKNTGHLEFAKEGFSTKDSIERIIKEFYRTEGFKVAKEKDSSIMEAKKDCKEYWIHLIEHRDYYALTVLENGVPHNVA